MHRVLVVDDEAEVVESLRRTLRQEPIVFVGTTSSLEALAIVERDGADLVIADIDMPEMNGLVLVSRIRKVRPQVIRILLTGDASSESAMAAINEGEVHKYLTKPWNKDDLRRTVRNALSRLDEFKRSARSAATAELRDATLTDLERLHPGLQSVWLEDGFYALDGDRLAPLAAELLNPPRQTSLAKSTLVSGSLEPSERSGKT
jgi:DNA-binding NtrC family response regulator